MVSDDYTRKGHRIETLQVFYISIAVIMTVPVEADVI
jgi:hypothetical protein